MVLKGTQTKGIITVRAYRCDLEPMGLRRRVTGAAVRHGALAGDAVLRWSKTCGNLAGEAVF
ncbi:MAG: hypothetical protein HKL95_05010 [Phycisphaerae bacterium]|nr:hypothetical protein [Phycisphaerae bacterium]